MIKGQQKIKVGIDIRDLKISKTGAHTYLYEVCNHLDKHSAIFEYVFLDTALPIYTGPNKLLKLSEQLSFFIWKQITLPIKANLKKCDLVFCSDYFVPYCQFGFKTIVVFYDAFVWEYPTHYNKYWLWLFNKIGIPAAKRAKYIITLTHYAKQQIAKYSGLEKEKIIPIYLGPKTKTINNSSNELTDEVAKFNWLFNKQYLLHVGTLEKRKNIEALINAFELLLSNGDTITYLVFVGQPSNKETLNENSVFYKINNSQLLSERIIFTGFLSDESVASFYKHATLYIFPSINEGFGIPVLEAFAHQLPVAIANNSCLPEVAGDAAISFDPYDVTKLFELIKKLLDQPDLRKELIEKGLQRLEYFSWDKTVLELEQVFQKAYDNM
jgi:glycosyltransferase involved in cell wall biosynthesis